MKTLIEFTLNNEPASAQVSATDTLLEVLRRDFGLTGAKEGCGVGECGACTVIMNGLAVSSCLLPALEADGCQVLTVEGLAKPNAELDEIQQAFVERGAIQCGFCTPGMVMSAKALLDKDANPTEGRIRTAIEGNLCRCTGYQQIIEAIQSAASRRKS